jgi:GntR family transcriptional regulator
LDQPPVRLQLDFRSHEPIYAQIVAQVKQMIAAGVLKPGDQLPTVRQLATDLRVNFNTVARAYRLLDEEGAISTQQGRGTYMLEPPSPGDQRKLRRAKLSELTRRYVAEAKRLGYEPDEVARSLEGELKAWSAERK